MISAWIACPVLFIAAMLVQGVAVIFYARLPYEQATSLSETLDKVSWVLLGLAVVAAMIAVLR